MGDSPNSDAMNAVLAEYDSLRQEVQRRSQAQQTLLNLGLGASGAVLAFAVAQEALLVALLQPFLACVLGLLYIDHGLQSFRISDYLASQTCPAADAVAGVGEGDQLLLMPWEEQRRADSTSWSMWVFPPAVAFCGLAALVLFATFPVVFGGSLPSAGGGEIAGALQGDVVTVRALFVSDALLEIACVVAFVRFGRKGAAAPPATEKRVAALRHAASAAGEEPRPRARRS